MPKNLGIFGRCAIQIAGAEFDAIAPMELSSHQPRTMDGETMEHQQINRRLQRSDTTFAETALRSKTTPCSRSVAERALGAGSDCASKSIHRHLARRIQFGSED